MSAAPDIKVSSARVDAVIAEIDRRLSEQVNALMHHPDFKGLESVWRGLAFLLSRIDYGQNIEVQIINVSKRDLLDDCNDAAEITRSGLFRQIYTNEYGQFGGRPIGAVIADYDFGPGHEDIALLRQATAVCAMAHAPFIAAAGKEMFDLERWEDLPNIATPASLFEMPRYARWRSFRESEDARYACLTLPKFLLRRPWLPEISPAESFNFTEDTDEVEDFCWGNTAFALASCMAASFAKYRWCVNIIGPDDGGAVEGLPMYSFGAGTLRRKIPLQALISERMEFALAEEGFTPLTLRKGAADAAFFSANSCQKPKVFPKTPEGREEERSYRLSTQLPFMMIMNRLAHYIKVIQREHIGAWKDRRVLEVELNEWINQYVTEMDDPDSATRGKRPLRMAHVSVRSLDGNPGWYAMTLRARPHFKYMGAGFTLTLSGRLERE